MQIWAIAGRAKARVNLTGFHGVFSSNGKLHQFVVPAKPANEAEIKDQSGNKAHSMTWAVIRHRSVRRFIEKHVSDSWSVNELRAEIALLYGDTKAFAAALATLKSAQGVYDDTKATALVRFYHYVVQTDLLGYPLFFGYMYEVTGRYYDLLIQIADPLSAPKFVQRKALAQTIARQYR